MDDRNFSSIYIVTIFIGSDNRMNGYRIINEYEATEDSQAHKHKKANINNCFVSGQAIFQGEGAYRFRYDSVLKEVDGNPIADWIACISEPSDVDYNLVISKMNTRIGELK